MEENKKSKLGLGILMGLLIAIIIGLASFIVYDKVLTKDDNKQVENGDNKENTEEERVEDLSLSSTLVKALRDIINSDSKEHLYKNNKVVFADEDISLKLSIAATYISDSFITDSFGYDCNSGVCGISYISEENIKNAYYEIFGSNSDYSRSTFNVYNNCAKEYIWSEQNNRYEAKIPGGCGDLSCGGPLTKPFSAKQIISSKENMVEIYDYFYYVGCAVYEDNIIPYYSDYAETNLIAKSADVNFNLFNEYTDKLGMYKYTFVDDGNGNYVFTSVERVNSKIE